MAGQDDMNYFSFSEHEAVIKPDDVLPDSLMIFDDVATEQQDIIRAYFCMGRHKRVDSFYLCQTYSRIPKQLLRDNANVIVLFRQDETNMKHVYTDHVNTDMTLTEFKSICAMCWSSSPHGFIVINKECDMKHGRYRLGFDNFIFI